MSKYLSIDEVANLLGISGDDVREWVSSGKVSATRRAGEMMITQQAMQDLMNNLPPEYEELKSKRTHVADGVVGRGGEAPLGRMGMGNRSGHTSRSRMNVKGGHAREMHASSGTPEPKFSSKGLSNWQDDDCEAIDGVALPSNASLRHSGASSRLCGASGSSASGEFSGIGIEQSLERLVEPLARTQARIVRAVTELKDRDNNGFDQKQLLASIEASIETRIAKLEAKSVEGNGGAGLATKELQKRIDEMFSSMSERLAEISVASKQRGESGDSEADREEFDRLKRRYDKLVEEYELLTSELDKVKSSSRERAEQMEADVEKVKAELKKTREEAESASGETEKSRKELSKLQEQLDGLQREKQEALDKAELLRKELDDLQGNTSELDEANKTIETLKGENSELQKRLENIPDLEPLESLRSSIGAGEAEGKELVEKVAEFVTSKQDEFAKLKDKYETCEEENSSLYLLIDGLQKETGSLKKMQAASESERNEANKNNEKLQAELEETKAALENAENERDAARQTLSDRELPNDKVQEELKKVREEHQEARKEISELKRQKEKLVEDLDRGKISYNSLRSENTNLSQLYGDAQFEADNLRRENEKLKADLEKGANQSSSQGSEEEIAKLRSQVEDMQQRFRQVSDERDTIKDNLKRVEDELVKASEERVKAQSECEDALIDRRRLQDELEVAQAELIAVTARAKASDSKQAELEQVTSGINQEISDLRSALNERERSYQAMVDERSELNSKVHDLNNRVVELECQVNEAKSECDKLRSNISEKDSKLVELSTSADNHQGDKVKLESTVSSLKEENQNLEFQLRAKVSQMAELENIVADYDSRLSSLSETISSLRDKNVELETEISAYKDAEHKLRQEISSKEQEIQSNVGVEEQISAAQRKFEERQAELERKNRELQGRADELKAALNKEIADRKADASKHDNSRKELQENFTKLEMERTRLLKRTNTFQAKIQALRAELEETRNAQANESEGLASMKHSVSVLQEELQASRDEYAALLDERNTLAEYLERLNSEHEAIVQQQQAGNADEADLRSKLVAYEVDSKEKDRIIQESRDECANLRDELDNSQRAFYELQQKHERERREWSEILAKQIRGADSGSAETPAVSTTSSGSTPLVGRLFKNRNNNGRL